MSQPPLPDEPPRTSKWAPLPVEGSSPYAHSTAAVVAGVILLVFALLVSLGSMVVLLSSTMLDRLLPAGREADEFLNIILAASAAFLVAGTAQLLAGVGILWHRSWGRYLGIAVAVLWCLLGVVVMFGSFAARETIPASGTTSDPTASIASGLGLLVIYGFVILALLLGGRHFEQRQVR